MGKAIKCHVDIRRLRKKLHELGVAKVPRATVNALNRAMEASRTRIVKEVGARETISAKRLKRRVRFERIDQARMDRMKSRVFVVLTKMPVSYFGAVRQTKAGAKVRGKLYPGAFKARMKSGHVGVFYRSGPRRFPITQVKERLSSDLPWISRRVVQTTGVETYQRRLTHELDRVKVWFEGKQA
jgi:hypothetical protein